MRKRSTRKQRRGALRPLPLETKWGWWPCIDDGWCVIPAALVRSSAGLGLSSEECWIFVQLLDLKWTGAQMTLQLLSTRCNATPDHVYLTLQSLQSRGFLRILPKRGFGRTPRNHPPTESGWDLFASVELDLSPLIHLLNDYIMKSGNLSAGFLRIAPPQPSQETPE